MTITLPNSESPFESIKQTHPSGAERWSARDLMPLMGYAAWRNFEVPLHRAMKAAENQSLDVARHFAGSRNPVESGTGGSHTQANFILTRFAAYLVAMNGDPNKRQVAAAQAYFAIRTREAEVAAPLTGAELLARAVLEASETIKAIEAERDALEAKAKADAPKVLFADAVSTSATTILIGELAKILKGNGLDIGQNRLFARLRDDGFLIKRRGTDHNAPTQRAMELGLFKVKETAITHSDGHVSISKTTKVTGKGQAYFIDYFLSDQLEMIEGGAA